MRAFIKYNELSVQEKFGFFIEIFMNEIWNTVKTFTTEIQLTIRASGKT